MYILAHGLWAGIGHKPTVSAAGPKADSRPWSQPFFGTALR